MTKHTPSFLATLPEYILTPLKNYGTLNFWMRFQQVMVKARKVVPAPNSMTCQVDKIPFLW